MNAFALAENALVPWPVRMSVAEAYEAVKGGLVPGVSYSILWSEADPDGLAEGLGGWEAWLVATPVGGSGRVVCPLLVDRAVRRGMLRRELAALVAEDEFVWAA